LPEWFDWEEDCVDYGVPNGTASPIIHDREPQINYWLGDQDKVMEKSHRQYSLKQL
jgi:hypothetical protein